MEDADYDDEDHDRDYDPEEVSWEQKASFDSIFAAGELERLSAKDDCTSRFTDLAMRFEGQGEYVLACRRFADLYREAPPGLLRGFNVEQKEILLLLAVYLIVQGIWCSVAVKES